MRVTVVGIGYVGLATAAFWAANNQVKILDIVQEKIDQVNRDECPFWDEELDKRLKTLRRNGNAIIAEKNGAGSYKDSDAVIIAVPTNFDDSTGIFDTTIVEQTIDDAHKECPNATIIIRSTVQVGFCSSIANAHKGIDLVYSPEFLREGQSMRDSLQPNRVVVGAIDYKLARRYIDRLKDTFAANGESSPEVLLCSTAEAETAKLFSNAYLALRIAYFNELDSFALDKGIEASRVIRAVCCDERIGDYYNNPSFGYGGYCLPKDAKALLSCYGESVPNEIVSSAIASNSSRSTFLAQAILKRKPARVGIYRLSMKANSDNSRNSAVYNLIDELRKSDLPILIYEPSMHGSEYNGIPITGSLQELFNSCDAIIANRVSEELRPYRGRIFTRDIFHRD